MGTHSEVWAMQFGLEKVPKCLQEILTFQEALPVVNAFWNFKLAYYLHLYTLLKKKKAMQVPQAYK